MSRILAFFLITTGSFQLVAQRITLNQEKVVELGIRAIEIIGSPALCKGAIPQYARQSIHRKLSYDEKGRLIEVSQKSWNRAKGSTACNHYINRLSYLNDTLYMTYEVDSNFVNCDDTAGVKDRASFDLYAFRRDEVSIDHYGPDEDAQEYLERVFKKQVSTDSYRRETDWIDSLFDPHHLDSAYRQQLEDHLFIHYSYISHYDTYVDEETGEEETWPIRGSYYFLKNINRDDKEPEWERYEHWVSGIPQFEKYSAIAAGDSHRILINGTPYQEFLKKEDTESATEIWITMAHPCWYGIPDAKSKKDE